MSSVVFGVRVVSIKRRYRDMSIYIRLNGVDASCSSHLAKP